MRGQRRSIATATIQNQLSRFVRRLRFDVAFDDAFAQVKASKDNLQKAAIIMSAQLNKLLLKEPSIEVDGKNYAVADVMQEKYLFEGQRLLLTIGIKRLINASGEIVKVP